MRGPQYGPDMTRRAAGAPVALLVDALPALALGVITAIGLMENSEAYAEPAATSAVLLVAAALSLAARRRHPAATVLVAGGLVATYLVGLSEDLTRQPPFEPFLVMVVAFFALGLHADGRGRTFGALGAGGALLAAEMLTVAAGRPLGEVVPSLLFWAAAFTLGAVMRRLRTHATFAEDSMREVERRRDEDVRAALSAERGRIARELHDVVAHSLSVMVVQASVEARLRREQDPHLGATLGTIEATGRAALDDLRRMLGLLRAAPGDADLREPMPTLIDLDAAVARLRAAGHDVTLSVRGDVASLPPGVGLSAYRIAQEALTNAVKHAPGSSVRVEIRYDGSTVVVAVEDDGPQAGTPAPGDLPGGHGLLGMRERVRLYAGTLETGPRSEGGFGVRALLPARTES